MTHFKFTSYSKAFRRLPLLLLATLALYRCNLFDIFPPEIEIITPKEGTSYFGTLPVEVKATDNRRVDKVEVFVNGTSIHEFTKSPYKTDISLGQYSAASVNMKAIAHDQAGNSAEASRDVNVTIGLRLTAPNGGETWNEQSSQTITWESSGNVGSSLGLNYSVDDGDTWKELISSTPNDGSYDWTVPNFIETESACKIKVSTSQYDDISDSTFTITAEPNTLTLTAPNGGETWAEQSTQTITWSYSGDVGDNVSLALSLDGGITWQNIIASTENDGLYSWVLPNFLETSTTCRVKVASTSTNYFDVSDDDFAIIWSPILVGSYDTPGLALSVFVSGSYAYVADYMSGLQIIDVSNPTSPTLAGSYDTRYFVPDVFVSGSYAYVADHGGSLKIINVSDPASPTLAGTYYTPTYAYGVFVSGGYTYVADKYSGLQVINVSNPASPTLAGSCDTPGGARGVFVSGSYAYVADDASGLQVINVSNPASPTLAGTYNTPGHAVGVFVSGSYAYVADEESGLLIFDVSGLP